LRDRVEHPLDPLSAGESTTVAGILRREQCVGATSDGGWRIASIELAEPGKDELAAFDDGGPTPPRRAVVICLQRANVNNVATVSKEALQKDISDRLAKAGEQPESVTRKGDLVGETAPRGRADFDDRVRVGRVTSATGFAVYSITCQSGLEGKVGTTAYCDVKRAE
jgi:hypothetical protein